jgi:predicted ATPase
MSISIPLTRRIELTGGPGGGKTTAADLFRREMADHVVLVPESATLLFSGGFPRSENPLALRAAQSAIFHVQRNLEIAQSALFPDRILMCDRGTVDGAAYWPGPADEFFAEFHTTLDAEIARYDAVIFFESAAVGGDSIEGGNHVRNESRHQAIELNERLKALWALHPRFVLVPHHHSFIEKLESGLTILKRIVSELALTPLP